MIERGGNRRRREKDKGKEEGREKKEDSLIRVNNQISFP